MTRWTRRQLLATGGLAVGGLASASALAGCSGKSGDGGSGSASQISEDERTKALDTPTELTFWTWVPDISKEIQLFEKTYPKIKVKVENVGQGAPHYQKVRTALKAGEGGPDVVQMEYQYIASFTVTKSLLDLTPYGAKGLADQFVDWVWKQVAGGGAVWAIPQDSGPMGNLYRKDIMDKAGITEAPKTWDDYYQAAQAVKSRTSSLICDFAPNQSGAVVGLLWQAGAKPFGYDGKETVTVDLTGPKVEQVMSYWQKLIQEGLVGVETDFTDSWYQALAGGKYAGWVTAAWGPVFLQGTAAKTSGKWRAAPLPQWESGKQISGNWGGSSNAVLKQSKNPIAAYELAKWINTDPTSTLTFANEQFLFPSTTSTLEEAAWSGQESKFYGGQKVNALFADISQTVDPEFQWLPFMEYVYSEFGNTVSKAVTKKGELMPAMTAWESAVKDYAKQQGFTVK